MSFSSEQKSAIIEKNSKSQCCRRAMLLGIMFAKGYCLGTTVTLSLERRDCCDFTAKLVREFYGKDCEIKRAADGGRRYVVSFDSNSAAKYIAEIKNSDLFISKCDACQSSFLKGIFLASARATDPKEHYSIHFTLGDRADKLAEYLTELGMPPLIFDSENGKVLYYKDSTLIESFYGYAGMNNAMFALIDAKFVGEVRKNSVRIANCETNNIKKAVDAAGKQLDIIIALDEANLLSSLPDDLEATARLRLLHRDMSLAQLAAVSNPPISKPGLSHRFKKIIEIGERLLHSK